MKNFSYVLNQSLNISGINQCPERFCNISSDIFTISIVNLISLTVMFFLWNRYIYQEKYSFLVIDKLNRRQFAHWLTDKIFLVAWMLNFGLFFFYLAQLFIGA